MSEKEEFCCLNMAGDEYHNTFRIIAGHHPYCPKLEGLVETRDLKARIDSIYSKVETKIEKLNLENLAQRELIARLEAENEKLKELLTLEKKKASSVAKNYAHIHLTLHNELSLYHNIVTNGKRLKFCLNKEASLWKVGRIYFVINRIAIFEQGEITEKDAIARFKEFASIDSGFEDYKNRIK